MAKVYCQDCQYFEESMYSIRDRQAQEFLEKNTRKTSFVYHGTCRINPPVVSTIQAETKTHFPYVSSRDKDWCGKGVAKEITQ